MKRPARTILAVLALVALLLPAAAAAREGRGIGERRTWPKGFVPAVARADRLARYFVQMRAPSSAETGGAKLTRAVQSRAVSNALAAQRGAIAQAEQLGGTVVFRYARLVNAFSVQMTTSAAAQLARRADVARVEPVPVVTRLNDTSVPFIGAPKVWKDLGVKGQGMTVAVVDTGVDYTHADFGGPGTVDAYTSNDPTVIEPGTFPTRKVIGGYDFTGADYDVLDASTSNDLPVPDPDPLDKDGHGTHVAGTCCGIGVPGSVGRGVAPKAKILAVKVWDVGNSTADVLVAGYEFAMDPNGDGNMRDAADVLSFSGGVDHGPASSVEAEAAAEVVKQGTVFVAAAGNAGNQPAGGSGYILGTPASVPGVIAVAASIDRFVAQKLTVDSPSGIDLPDGGPVVWQDWSPPFTSDITGDVVDAREFDPPAASSGLPAPTDQILCDAVPPGSPFDGKIALVYKGSFDAGDCFVEDKVINAQDAGAIAVIIWDGFGGLPGGIGTGGNEGQVTIPVVDLSGNDSEALASAISPNAPASWNQETVSVTIGAAGAVIPGYEDRMTDFTSEGPARISSALKPDVAAPGADITSAAVGSGDGAATFSGTSMATPHVSGVATLLSQLHPTWSPARIKALIMNQATQRLENLDGSGPVPATVTGSGRVQAYDSAIAETLATPGSLSFELRAVSDLTTIVKHVKVTNLDGRAHRYTVSGAVRSTDLAERFASVRVSVDGETLHHAASFTLPPRSAHSVWMELTLDPSAVPKRQQEWGWYYVNPNVDGNLNIVQRGGTTDKLHVPWHVAPLAAADSGMSKTSLDLTGGPKTMKLTGVGAGVPFADLYLLGAASGKGDRSEADIRAIGARSFTGDSVDGAPEGLPDGADPFAGIGWVDFLTADDVPTEPVEFAVQTWGVRNTTETEEIDVVIDVGADGVFADGTIGGDVLLVEMNGLTALYRLPSTFDAPDATYFPDYSNYNSTVTGIVADAEALGLSDAEHVLSYRVTACTGVFSGDVPAQTCETVGDIDPTTGTYGPMLDVTAPALAIDPLVCRGFWSGGPCTGSRPVTVAVGSAVAGDDPSILAVFPNNAPGDQGVVIDTST
ncbi:MAG: S8 family serine peptidase [Candidatus Velamenicoccus archaeovorus]